MPFTPSHVVAILPLTSGRRARCFDTAALSIGAMVPDLPYFVPPHVGAGWTHAWFGPGTLDLALGLAVLAIWRFFAPALTDLSPRWLRWRLPVTGPRRGRRHLLVAVLSVVVGATTHVAWDSFSHPHRWGTEHVAWLAQQQGPLPGYKWVQYGSGVVGLLLLGLWLARWVVRTPAGPAAPESDVEVRRRLGVWILLGTILAATVATTWARAATTTGAWLDERVAVRVATATIGAALATLVLLAAGWRSASAQWSGRRTTRRVVGPDVTASVSEGAGDWRRIRDSNS